jgi:CRISPR-associated exonuclease Cas4
MGLIMDERGNAPTVLNDDWYSEDDLLAVSLLQHLLFCPRRAALVLHEGQWSENVSTATGKIFHDGVDEQPSESRGAIRIARHLRLRSLRLGLVGQADVVEFHQTTETDGLAVPGLTGSWRPFPVEYKSGQMRPEPGYLIQLCAQALCLEEMLNGSIAEGALFFGGNRRRLDVHFNQELRCKTEQAARELHELAIRGTTPSAVFNKKCAKCSLYDLCQPKTIGSGKSAKKWLGETLDDVVGEAS